MEEKEVVTKQKDDASKEASDLMIERKAKKVHLFQLYDCLIKKR